MDFYRREMDAISRILAAFEVLAAKHGLAIPDGLETVSGPRPERRAKRLEAMAMFVEGVALETIQPGLASKLAAHGYTEIAVLRHTEDEDLLALDGVGKAALRELRRGLAMEPEPALDDEPIPSLDEILSELSGDDGA